MEHLFLDANAHVPLLPAAHQSAQDFDKSLAAHGHSSSPSRAGRAAAAALEEARQNIALSLGCKPDQIIFTNSCTQACQWAFTILSKKSGLPYISALEHPAVTQACQKSNGQIYQTLPTSPQGQVAFPDIKEAVASVTCIHLQNEIGTIQKVEEIKNKYPKSLVFSDVSQSVGKVPVNLLDLNVDVAAVGPHKFGGPSGIGVLFLKDSSMWSAFGSGSRYFLDVPGTPNVRGAVMTAAALREATKTLPGRTQRMLAFQSALEPALEELGFEIVGKEVARSPNTTFVKTPTNSLQLLLELGNHNIHVGLGSACGSLHTGDSPILQALGREGDNQEYMRISQFGDYDDRDADKFIKVLHKIMRM